jgi:hypothetical protein
LGGVFGASVGTAVGIASGGTAIAGTVPLAVGGTLGGGLVGEHVGDAAARLIRSNKCTKCGEQLVVVRVSGDS